MPRPANQGATVCNVHGAAAGQVKLAAARRVADGQAARVLEAWQPPDGDGGQVVDVTGELARLTARLVSLSDYLTGHVAAMPAEQWAAPDPETEAKVRLWQATAGQAGALLTALARLGIDLGREAREAEMERAQRRMAGWLSAKVDALLYELRLDARQRERIPDVVPAWIRSLGEGEGG